MKRDESGIALVVVMFLMATLSALAVSMMFLAQTETAASKNYRTMSQARYAAEAGVHRAINYLMNSYGAPSSMANFDITKSPVTCINGCTNNASAGASCNASTLANAVSTGCVVLSGMTGIASNYPDASVRTAFASAGTGILAVNSAGAASTAGAGTVTYGTAAVLMSMRSVTAYGSSTATVIQTWQIISDGTVPPSTQAIVEVSSSLEREFGVAQTFAIFATGTGCGAISLSGNVSTASYDGSSVSTSGGNVGTNGNMDIQGHVDVHGSLSSPRTGVGSCTDSATGVTALTETGAASVDNNAIVQLPQALNFPIPSAPSPAAPTGTSMAANAATCTLVYAANPTILPATWCSYASSTVTITPPTSNTIVLGNISGSWVFNSGTYNVNSVGSGNMGIGSTGNVTFNLQGKNSDGSWMTNPFNLNGQAVVNTSMNAARLQVLYAGTGTIDMTGGSNAAMLLYAPNATAVTHGNSDIYGSLLVKQVTSAGTPRFIYDTRLQSQIVTLGSYMMSSFSWKKY